MPTNSIIFNTSSSSFATTYTGGSWLQSSGSPGRLIVGYNSSLGSSATFIRFRTPSYVGTSTNISIRVSLWEGSYSSVTIRASISSSLLTWGQTATYSNMMYYVDNTPGLDPGRVFSDEITISNAASIYSNTGTNTVVINTGNIAISSDTEYMLILSRGTENGYLQILRDHLVVSGSVVSPDLITITYNGNAQGGGSVTGVPGSETILKGGKIELPLLLSGAHSTTTSQLDIKGYVNDGTNTLQRVRPTINVTWDFVKWNSKSDGTGVDYEHTLENPSGEYTFNSSITLYAIWIATYTQASVVLTVPSRASTYATRYTATLDARGGIVSPSSLSNRNISTYTFKEWNTRSDGTGVSYSKTYTFRFSITVYAQWNTTTTYVNYIKLPIPTYENHNFKGWSSDSTALVGQMEYIILTSDITLYAIWVYKGIDYTMYLGREKIDKVYLGEQEVKFCIPIE